MERKILIAKVIKKLSRTEIEPNDLYLIINDLKSAYQKNKNKDYEDQSLPKEILKLIGNFMDRHTLDQKDKLFILKEAKRNKFFNFSLNRHLEKAWRLILKKWNISNYRLEGGL